jgi:hypothetical protein
MTSLIILGGRMIIIEVFERGCTHGIGRQVQQPSSGSTPHDRVTILQICSWCSLPIDRPRQSMSRYPPVIANRPTTYAVRRQPPLIPRQTDLPFLTAIGTALVCCLAVVWAVVAARTLHGVWYRYLFVSPCLTQSSIRADLKSDVATTHDP